MFTCHSIKFLLILILMLYLNILFADQLPQKELQNIVPVSWLIEHFDNPRLVILDIRKYNDYKKDHVTGAINIPGHEKLFNAKTRMMPKLDKLRELFSNAGIDDNSLVVAYDNGEFAMAARLYWILEVLGHKNVGILEYSYGNYLKNNLPISTIDTKAQRKNFIPKIENEQIQTKLSTLLAIGKKTIIDGRASEHYLGKKSFAKRFGHIPTAKNYACTNNFKVTKNGSRMKSFAELEKIYKKVPKDKDVVLYCTGGAQAALNYVVLQKLGYKASVYDGSWKEWGNDPAVPIVNFQKKKANNN